MWAEKELHNLVKMSRHGLRVPDAVLLKKHVLLMSFIGKYDLSQSENYLFLNYRKLGLDNSK